MQLQPSLTHPPPPPPPGAASFPTPLCGAPACSGCTLSCSFIHLADQVRQFRVCQPGIAVLCTSPSPDWRQHLPSAGNQQHPFHQASSDLLSCIFMLPFLIICQVLNDCHANQRRSRKPVGQGASSPPCLLSLLLLQHASYLLAVCILSIKQGRLWAVIILPIKHVSLPPSSSSDLLAGPQNRPHVAAIHDPYSHHSPLVNVTNCLLHILQAFPHTLYHCIR